MCLIHHHHHHALRRFSKTPGGQLACNISIYPHHTAPLRQPPLLKSAPKESPHRPAHSVCRCRPTPLTACAILPLSTRTGPAPRPLQSAISNEPGAMASAEQPGPGHTPHTQQEAPLRHSDKTTRTQAALQNSQTTTTTPLRPTAPRPHNCTIQKGKYLMKTQAPSNA